LIGPTAGWSETVEYDYLSQYQFPFARNIISYVLGKCENLVGVMMFGHKAADNILPWLRDNYSKKILIQNMFLNHPQNIKFSYTLEHAQNYVETFRAIMSLLGVDIPPLDGHVQLRFLMSKKRTLEMCVCVEEFVDSAVLEAAASRKEMQTAAARAAAPARREMKAAAAAAAAARAAVKRNTFLLELAGSQPSCVLSASKRKDEKEGDAGGGGGSGGESGGEKEYVS
jgi:hypothetical protein